MGNKRDGKFYLKNEKKIMQSLNLTPTPQSGAGWIHKEDGYNSEIVAQLKSTDADSYRINLLDWNKLLYHANVEHKAPLFVVEFLTNGEQLLILRKQDIERIALSITGVERLEYKEEGNIEVEAAEKEENEIIKSTKKSREEFYKERESKWTLKKN